MIKFIVKRNGEKEAFQPNKINGWGEWASKTLGYRVDWSSVVLHVIKSLPETCTSEDLQNQLIKECLNYNTWSYNRMAGRLYVSLMSKQIYGSSTPPTVKEVHQRLFEANIMVKLDYSDTEYQQIEKMIDHNRDLKASYYELQFSRNKYALKDRVNNKEYETQQFIYMRMAMALAEDQPKERRMADVKKWYNLFSLKKLSAPTPNFVNLGTKLKGFSSCILYRTNDKAPSLAIGDHIAYTMTCMAAGIGANIVTRGLGEPIRGGLIKHLGKLPYYRALNGAVHANMQNGRAGACTVHYSCFDPEVETICQLKNPMQTEDKKIRGMDYSFQCNKFFAKKAAKGEKVFTFSCQTAPDLWEAFYSADQSEFESLYKKYEEDPLFKKHYVDARGVLLTILNESYETGRAYLHFVDESNKHTPFKDTIYSSNLCVTGNTRVISDRGLLTAKELYQQGGELNLFDGHTKVSSSPMKLRGKNEDVYRLTLDNGLQIEATDYHDIPIINEKNEIKKVKLKDVKLGEYVPKQIKKGLFGTKSMEDEAFLLGLYQSDGSQSKQGIELCLWENDFDLINEVEQRFYKVFYKYKCDTYKITNQFGKTFTRTIRPPKFHDSKVRTDTVAKKTLKSNCLRKSLNFEKGTIPQWVYESDEKTQWQYIRGLYYGDGCARVDKKGKGEPVYISYTSINKSFLKELQILLSNLGISTTLCEQTKTKKMLLPDGNGGKKLYDAKDSWRLVFSNKPKAIEFNKYTGFLDRKEVVLENRIYRDNSKKRSAVIAIEYIGKQDVYCPTVYTDEHVFIANGMLTGNCQETLLPTKGYETMLDLYSDELHHRGEIASCSLAAVNVSNIKNDEEYEDVMYYALLMIDKCIHMSDYPLLHLGQTAKARLSAGIGIINLAHYMAKNHKSYMTKDGKQFMHELAERHMYYGIKASLKLGKELGNAPWINKTKWVDGWLPIDTYNKNLDKVVEPVYQYDWEGLRKDIQDNGGIRNSVLIAHMPTESSSNAAGATNGLYPIRDFSLLKGNNNNITYWAAPDGDKYQLYYERAWDVPYQDMIECYGIFQKFTDQGISADLYRKILNDDVVPSSEMIKVFLYCVKFGLKSRYYMNTLTSEGVDLEIDDKGCASGACSL